MRIEKYQQAVFDLKNALDKEGQALTDRFVFAGISKTFEVCFEYAWKMLRHEVMSSGLDAESPRTAMKQAGKVSLIDNVEAWLEFLRIRNLAVHDDLGVPPEKYLETIKSFFHSANELLAKLNALK